MATVAVLAVVALCVLVVRIGRWEARRAAEGARGIVCPRCRVQGCVSVTVVRPGGGLSAAATSGMISGGLSLLGTAANDVESVSSSCSHCGAHWESRP